ncbi:DUF3953 domain-containing protein [Lysinibacillus sp. NPDC097162]|uniref:DUF3953 domain-containing protein n=1 Tax=unclassified Lysinibacillus TaxID=2636778 RepID=UPI003829C51C
MKFIKISLTCLIVFIFVYSLIKNDFLYSPISSLLLGCLLAIVGLEQFKKRRNWGYLFSAVSLLVIVVSIYSF